MQSPVSSPFSLLFLYFLKAGLWNNVKEGIFISSGKLGQLTCIIVLLHGYFGNRILGHPTLQQGLLWKYIVSAEVVANCCSPDTAVESLFILYFSKWRLITNNSLFIVVFIQCFQTNLLCNKMATENRPFKWTKSYLYSRSFHQERWYCLWCLFIVSVIRFYVQFIYLQHSVCIKQLQNTLPQVVYLCAYMCVCVCTCVGLCLEKKERERLWKCMFVYSCCFYFMKFADWYSNESENWNKETNNVSTKTKPKQNKATSKTKKQKKENPEIQQQQRKNLCIWTW